MWLSHQTKLYEELCALICVMWIIFPIRCLQLEQWRFFFLIDLDFCCVSLRCCRQIIKRKFFLCRGGMVFWGGRTCVLPFFIHPHLTQRENAMKIKPDSRTDGIHYELAARTHLVSLLLSLSSVVYMYFPLQSPLSVSCSCLSPLQKTWYQYVHCCHFSFQSVRFMSIFTGPVQSVC